MTSAPLPNRRSTQLEREAAARVGGLFERHGRMVYGVCRAMLRDVHEAEDAAQQVFLSAHKGLLGGARVRDPGGWLATVARNECRGRIAAGMRAPLPVSDEDLAAIPSPIDEQARHDQALEFRAALEALPERQREAVVLRYLYGLRYGEVAAALGISRAATEALLFRARRGLRGRLRPVVGTVLVVPIALRQELALAIPGFPAGTGTGAASLGIGAAVLAKLTTAPIGLKVATAAVAVSTVGVVGTIESDQTTRGERDSALGAAAFTKTASDNEEARSDDQQGRSGQNAAAESVDEDRSDSGSDRDSDSDDTAESDGSGQSSGSGNGGSRSSGGDDSGANSTSADDPESGGSGESTDTKPEENSGTSIDSSGSGSSGSDADGMPSGSSSSSSGSSAAESSSSGSGSGSSDSSGRGSSEDDGGSESDEPPDDENT